MPFILKIPEPANRVTRDKRSCKLWQQERKIRRSALNYLVFQDSTITHYGEKHGERHSGFFFPGSFCWDSAPTLSNIRLRMRDFCCYNDNKKLILPGKSQSGRSDCPVEIPCWVVHPVLPGDQPASPRYTLDNRSLRGIGPGQFTIRAAGLLRCDRFRNPLPIMQTSRPELSLPAKGSRRRTRGKILQRPNNGPEKPGLRPMIRHRNFFIRARTMIAIE